jgi:hypothetical protein
VIETATGKFIVKDTIKVVGGKIAHIGYVENGEIKLHDTAKLFVDADKRLHTCQKPFIKPFYGDNSPHTSSYVCRKYSAKTI